MFAGIRARVKLKTLGYVIRASRNTPMCYEVYNLSKDKREGYLLKDRDGWYIKHDRQIWFTTPEEAALWMCGGGLL
ncbi:MAG: hypothetical protein US07_C0005G0003 [Candidatus Levybacteria bacterium GW2011_GWB1_36_18]|nr:MAG: hypothetical protein US07_C0005G0003 [Candidatus Levybacteria bacterium GW2011_GWB1_36_18]